MTLPVPPTPPATVDSTTWQTWDVALRYDWAQQNATYQAAYLAAMQANTAALNRQADAVFAAAAAQTSAVKAMNSESDAELVAQFLAALCTDCVINGRGAIMILANAKALLAEYRKVYPAPTP